MSVAGTARLASVRDTAPPDTAVKNSDIGADKQDPTKWQDTLAKLVPGEVIAIYSGLLTLYLGLIEKPSTTNPTPNQYVPGRITMWAVGVAVTWFVAYWTYRNATPKSKRRVLPKEIVVAMTAFAAWGLSTPGSWLIELFDSKVNRIMIPAAIAALGAVILGVIATKTTSTEPPKPT